MPEPSRVGCFSRADLEAHLSGRRRITERAAHLEACLECRALADKIRTENTLLDEVAAVARLNRRSPRPAGPGGIPGYEIQRELHRGGQGVIHLAKHIDSQRTVALKMPLAGTRMMPAEQRRFEREIELAAGLRHPNIVTLYESGITPDGMHYYAMEYVDGETLLAYVTRRYRSGRSGIHRADSPSGEHTRLSRNKTREIVAMFMQICDAVAHAHQRGVIHRDLKPANILVDKSGTPFILDFGLSKSATESRLDVTLAGDFAGTLDYAAPEQLSGMPEGADVRTDVYALGLILYELLTGARPYPSDGAIDTRIRHILTTVPRRASSLASGIDSDLDALLDRALSKQPQDRYSSAAALLDDLRAYLAFEPLAARRGQVAYQIRRAMWRLRVPLTLALLAMSALAVFAIFVTLQYRRATRAEAEIGAQLRTTNVERGRLAALTGAIPLAEDLLWTAFLNSNEIPGIERTDRAFWGLLELYARDPCFASVALTPPTHGKWMTQARFEENDRILLLMWRDGTCQWMDRATRRIVREQRLSVSSAVTAIVADEGDACVLFEDCRVLYANLATNEVHTLLESETAVFATLRMSITGTFAAVGADDGQVSIFDFRGPHPTWPIARLKIGDGPVLGLSIFDEGTRVATLSSDKRIQVWDCVAMPPRIIWERDNVATFGLSDQSRVLIAHNYDEASTTALALDTGEPEAAAASDYQHVQGYAFPGSGRYYLAVTQNTATLEVYDSETARHAGRIRGGRGRRPVYRWSRGEDVIAFFGLDSVCKFFDAPSSERVTRRVRAADTVFKVRADPATGGFVATDASGQLLEVAGAARGQQMHTGVMSSVAFAPDGKELASVGYDGRLKIWQRSADGFEERQSVTVGMGQNDVTWSPSGELIAFVGNEGGLHVWNRKQPGNRPIAWRASRLSCVDFSPDGQSIVIGARNGEVIALDVNTRQPRWVRAIARSDVRAVACSPNGKYIAVGGDDGTLVVLDPASGGILRALSGHERSVYAVAWRPDSRVLASADELGKTVLWDAESGYELAAFDWHSSPIFTLAFSSDGERLATGGADRTVQIHDLRAIECAVAGNLEAALARSALALEPSRRAALDEWWRAMLRAVE